MTLRIEYIASAMSDLDNIDGMDLYYKVGENFSVYVMETKEIWFPVFNIRENGDIDGFAGWK